MPRNSHSERAYQILQKSKQQLCKTKVNSKPSTSTSKKSSTALPLKKRLREESTDDLVLRENRNISKIKEKQRTKRRKTMESKVESRRQQFYKETDWRPIDDQMFPTPLKDGPDAENDDIIPLAASSLQTSRPRGKRPGVLQEINADHSPSSHYQFRNIFTPIVQCRASPLPTLSWADSDELWRSMVDKESLYYRSSAYLSRHEDLQPRMRSILLDWLMEVSEVYTLHRETFYLAIDYIDRYLSNTTNIHKTRLQLVGVTALFIAAKLEEIYPPKLTDFAYVTDGACTEEEIISQELLILSTLKWSLSPVTVVSWLNVYLQTAHAAFAANPPSSAFFLPQYPQETFVHISQLIDLCTLDIESLQFPSGVLAASALYHFSSRELATQVSGFQFKDIAACVHWMAPFAITVRDSGLQPMKQFRRVAASDAHNIQTHANNIDTLDIAMENRSRVQTQLATCQSPTEVGGFMTPPKSGQKQSMATTPLPGLCST
ncbi:G1/S-specific cyclin-E1-like isoform X2 [Clavelina lepadiformis]|uniref:Cyclin N-terminal domain-containing protein n=2 Tax=Clavelina lepadiformis TaxID=159417 RepID=A0ABP0F4S1_CLALP